MFYLSQSELVLNLLISAALFGVIWVVQLVQYPSFHFIAAEQWKAFHKSHRVNITVIVMPLMLCELALSAWLAGKNGFRLDYAVPLCMVLAIWVSTFLLQIPMHGKLEDTKDPQLIDRLVGSNWIRTILWSAKLVWVSWLAYMGLN